MLIRSKTITPPSISKNNVSLIILLVLILVFAIALLFKLTILVLLAIPLVIYHEYFAHSYTDPEKYFAGEISFSETHIRIDGSEFPLIGIEDLVIEINEYDGQVLKTNRSSRIVNGTDNLVKFCFNKHKMTTHFYINNEEVLNEFKELFHAWYRNKISFIETSKAGRTYCLEHLNYEQIREFKEKHGI